MTFACKNSGGINDCSTKKNIGVPYAKSSGKNGEILVLDSVFR